MANLVLRGLIALALVCAPLSSAVMTLAMAGQYMTENDGSNKAMTHCPPNDHAGGQHKADPGKDGSCCHSLSFAVIQGHRLLDRTAPSAQQAATPPVIKQQPPPPDLRPPSA